MAIAAVPAIGARLCHREGNEAEADAEPAAASWAHFHHAVGKISCAFGLLSPLLVPDLGVTVSSPSRRIHRLESHGPHPRVPAARWMHRRIRRHVKDVPAAGESEEDFLTNTLSHSLRDPVH